MSVAIHSGQISRAGKPWACIDRAACALGAARRRLDQMLEERG